MTKWHKSDRKVPYQPLWLQIAQITLIWLHAPEIVAHSIATPWYLTEKLVWKILPTPLSLQESLPYFSPKKELLDDA